MISENISAIRERISLACARAGRKPSEVTLVAVAKTFPATAVREAIRGGVRDIGENYVQEVLRKRAELRQEQVQWHFVGHLQKNKVRHIAPWVHIIHAVDSSELLQEINRRASQVNRVIDCLIEVNTTGESTKHGISSSQAVNFAKSLANYDHVRIVGLMTIGPFLPDPEGSRPMFKGLRQLKEEITSFRQNNIDMQHLSMGMTGDFEVAIEEGATLIRIGTAIFGTRTRQFNSGGQNETDTA